MAPYLATHVIRRVVMLLLLSAVVGSVPQCDAQVTRRRLTEQDVTRMIRELSNWGRWGEDDQLGTLNLITNAKRKQAAALVKLGVSVSLARTVETKAAPDNPKPFQHQMLATGSGTGMWSMDSYHVAYHGLAHTHMDSLCHLFHNGKMYNGIPRSEVKEEGAARLHILNVKGGILTRGILMDIPRLRGVKYLEPGTPIYPEDLSAWENRAGVKVGSGDVVFVRTGRWARRAEKGPWDAAEEGLAGLHASCAKWFKERDIAMLGSDAASDVIPSQVEGVTHPVHVLMLHAMGVHIFDNCDFRELSETAARLGRWEFMLTAAPLAVRGGTGSPLNPIATF